MKRNCLISIICLWISGCTQPQQTYCHAWTKAEIEQLKAADRDLPPDSILHALIKDYEVQCAN